jgi:hypothetical protein
MTRSTVPASITLTDDSTCPIIHMDDRDGGHFQIASGDVVSIEWYACPTKDGTFKEAIDPDSGSAITQTVADTGDYVIPYALNGRLFLQPRAADGTAGVMVIGVKTPFS